MSSANWPSDANGKRNIKAISLPSERPEIYVMVSFGKIAFKFQKLLRGERGGGGVSSLRCPSPCYGPVIAVKRFITRSRSRQNKKKSFQQSKMLLLITRSYVVGYFVNFLGDFWVYLGRDNFSRRIC